MREGALVALGMVSDQMGAVLASDPDVLGAGRGQSGHADRGRLCRRPLAWLGAMSALVAWAAPWLVAAIGALVVALGLYRRSLSRGRDEAESGATRQTFARVEDGIDAVAAVRNGKTPDQVVRENDAQW